LKENDELEELQVLFTVQKGYLLCIPSSFRDRLASLEGSHKLDFVFSSSMGGGRGGGGHGFGSGSSGDSSGSNGPNNGPEFDDDDVRSKFVTCQKQSERHHYGDSELCVEDGRSEFNFSERPFGHTMEVFDYFKSPQMLTLDEKLGDIMSQIRDIESEIVQEVESAFMENVSDSSEGRDDDTDSSSYSG
jgi:hypothetical protein